MSRMEQTVSIIRNENQADQTIEGCNGAYTYSYLKTAADSGLGLTHESTYPYLNNKPKLTCPSGLAAYNQGAKVSHCYEDD